ncbi:hypothetical protein CesoFtcFv8_019275 [Champsocephalus esox]|uniref:Uncharacterized protein n=1 Tax=Champsocephalus esox TaxID=159716 RepID=A0AAN8GPZ2_9TELE|nr:hypothetical protein CesoFtcFv8_019275 [Champsocephalus esox]
MAGFAQHSASFASQAEGQGGMAHQHQAAARAQQLRRVDRGGVSSSRGRQAAKGRGIGQPRRRQRGGSGEQQQQRGSQGSSAGMSQRRFKGQSEDGGTSRVPEPW